MLSLSWPGWTQSQPCSQGLRQSPSELSLALEWFTIPYMRQKLAQVSGQISLFLRGQGWALPSLLPTDVCHATGVEELLDPVGTGCQSELYLMLLVLEEQGGGAGLPRRRFVLCGGCSAGFPHLGAQDRGWSSSVLRWFWEWCFLQHPGTTGDSYRARLLSNICIGESGEVGMQLALEALVASGDSDVLSGLVTSHGCLLARNRASHALLSSWVYCGVCGRPQDGASEPLLPLGQSYE